MDAATSTESHPLTIKTLEERCHSLSQQLRAVEEENQKLRIQLNMGGTSEQTRDASRLIQNYEELKTQNLRCLNQLNLITTENQNLWMRISKLAKMNNKLTRQLAAVSDSLKTHSMDNKVPSEGDRKNLEELSAKLLSSLKMEKMELESQFAEMVDLQNANDLSASTTDQDLMAHVSKHVEKLNKFKQLILLQQNQLRDAIKAVSKFTPDIIDDSSINSDKQICPFCLLEVNGNKDLFADHVETHFENDLIS